MISRELHASLQNRRALLVEGRHDKSGIHLLPESQVEGPLGQATSYQQRELMGDGRHRTRSLRRHDDGDDDVTADVPEEET